MGIDQLELGYHNRQLGISSTRRCSMANPLSLANTECNVYYSAIFRAKMDSWDKCGWVLTKPERTGSFQTEATIEQTKERIHGGRYNIISNNLFKV